jgi:protein SCO1/2
MSRIYALIAAGTVAAFLAASLAFVLLGRGDDPFAPCRSSTVAGGAGAIGGAFTLLDQNGRPVTDAEVIDRPALVYFGYTFCPDICPFDIVRNADAADLLAEAGHEVRPVFITVDPARDTPEVLADFAANIHPAMIALGGSAEQVAAAAKAYRVFYSAHSDEGEYYLVDHSTFTYLVLPGHGFVEFFRRDLPAEDLARQAACFLERD